MDQTRIIIKNIPKFLKDKELSEQFSSVGDLTDCKILRTYKGKSRGFAFVGYKTHEQAQKAIDSFNNTFINTSKIQVDFAKPIGDESLENCYARIRKAPKGNNKSKNKESEDDDTDENESIQSKRPPLIDDPEFQEFLAASRAKNAWNEGFTEYLEQHERDIEMKNQKKKQKTEEKKDKAKSDGQTKNIESDNDNEDDDEDEDEAKYDSTRVYITNVPYSVREEDLEQFFSKYGKIISVQVPYDKIAQRGKGYAYVTFADFEGIKGAMKDSLIFQGRHLKLKPADPPPNQINSNEDQNKNDDDEPYLLKKRRLQKVEKPESWNSLFLNKDTVAEATARMLGYTKSQILNPESDDIASRLAIAESQLVNDTKDMFQKAGIDVSLLNAKTDSSTKLSRTLIIVKNLKYETTEDEIRNMFAAYGSLVRFIFPQTHAVALVEFARPEDARKAYNGLALKKLHDEPIYLQWAPVSQDQSNHIEDNNEDETIKTSSKQLKTTTLIMKNVPFKATKKEIYDLVNAYAKVKAVRMIKKSDGSGHRGFVFLDFNTRQEATAAMDNLGNIHLYGRHLVVQPADVGRNADSIVQENRQYD